MSLRPNSICFERRARRRQATRVFPGQWESRDDQSFRIADEPLPAALNPDVDDLVAQALRDRPDLAALRLNEEALNRFAEAEKRLRNPSVSSGGYGRRSADTG